MLCFLIHQLYVTASFRTLFC